MSESHRERSAALLAELQEAGRARRAALNLRRQQVGLPPVDWDDESVWAQEVGR